MYMVCWFLHVCKINVFSKIKIIVKHSEPPQGAVFLFKIFSISDLTEAEVTNPVRCNISEACLIGVQTSGDPGADEQAWGEIADDIAGHRGRKRVTHLGAAEETHLVGPVTICRWYDDFRHTKRIPFDRHSLRRLIRGYWIVGSCFDSREYFGND